MQATVIGAGLAGSEAAWQLAERGIEVSLIEMKPSKRTPAHQSDMFAELVCSNSLRSDQLNNAVGLLKAELRLLGSLIMRAADASKVPAGGALAVDRESFSSYITSALRAHPHIRIIEQEVVDFPKAPCIIASGPLTSDPLARAIVQAVGNEGLSFFDAVAPIVSLESVDMSIAFKASRYDDGEGDYINCPMNEAQYDQFYEALMAAETAQLHGFEENMVFEGCMPVESMAKRGRLTLAHGPLKPVGLVDPHTGHQPFAVVQLRQDNAIGTLYNLVGFQTHLKFAEQKRVFSMIPGLENAVFERYGVMHRNTFLHAPGMLNPWYEWNEKPGIYFAGQMTGVEGYIESTASGFVAGWALARALRGMSPISFGSCTAIGALASYISTPNDHFQPMNINFGLFEPLQRRMGRKQRYLAIAERSLSIIEGFACNALQ